MNQDLADKIEKLIPIELHKDYYSKYDVFNGNLNFEKYELNSNVNLNLIELTSWTSNIDIVEFVEYTLPLSESYHLSR